MTIIIQFYIITCIALLLFDLVFLMIKNRRTQELYPKNTRFENEIRKEIQTYEETGEFSPNFRQSLPKKLVKIRNLITLVSLIREDEEKKKLFAPYICTLVDEYVKHPSSEQAYYAYVISLLDYEDASSRVTFVGKFMDLLDSNSIYTFSNAMNAIYHFGQTNLMLQALQKADERGEFYNSKLLIDGLLGGKFDFADLNPQLVSHFDSYSPYLQASLLDYFRMNGFDARELCLRLVKNQELAEEVRYTAMRYFIKYPCRESEAYFLDVLKNSQSDWVDQMLSIQGLSQADDPEVRNAIRNLVTSREWYVRVNAAKYLYHHDLSHQEVYQILSRRDQYANEILLYCCRDDEELIRFIKETIAAFEQEDKEKSQVVHKEAMA